MKLLTPVPPGAKICEEESRLVAPHLISLQIPQFGHSVPTRGRWEKLGKLLDNIRSGN